VGRGNDLVRRSERQKIASICPALRAEALCITLILECHLAEDHLLHSSIAFLAHLNLSVLDKIQVPNRVTAPHHGSNVSPAIHVPNLCRSVIASFVCDHDFGVSQGTAANNFVEAIVDDKRS
jgi:hypothetical protein